MRGRRNQILLGLVILSLFLCLVLFLLQRKTQETEGKLKEGRLKEGFAQQELNTLQKIIWTDPTGNNMNSYIQSSKTIVKDDKKTLGNYMKTIGNSLKNLYEKCDNSGNCAVSQSDLNNIQKIVWTDPSKNMVGFIRGSTTIVDKDKDGLNGYIQQMSNALAPLQANCTNGICS